MSDSLQAVVGYPSMAGVGIGMNHLTPCHLGVKTPTQIPILLTI